MSNKSYNDIQAQYQRVVSAAKNSPHFNGCGGRISISRLAQIAARTRAQHGISMFCASKDEKHPLIHPIRYNDTEDTAIQRANTVITNHWIEERKSRSLYKEMSAADRKHYEWLINELANHDMKKKVLAWIELDITLKVNGLADGDPLEIVKWLYDLAGGIIQESRT